MRLAVAAACAVLALAGCTDSPSGDAPTATLSVPTFAVTSPDVGDGGEIPKANTADAFDGQCGGDNVPLTLNWTGAPDGTQAYAVTMIDVDAGEFAHWLLTDVSGAVVGIGPANLAGAITGMNDAGGTGYFGPCPPGPDHHYVITVYALDAALGLEPGFRIRELQTALAHHVLGVATLTGERSGPA